MTTRPQDPIPVYTADGAGLTVSALPALTDTIRHKQLTVGITKVAFTSGALLNGVTLKADDDNAGSIYVGNSTLSLSNGYRLKAGQSVFLSVGDLSHINAIASEASQLLYAIGT